MRTGLFPIISFVARQRDLRDLVGANQAGALQLQFADTLRYWEARFDRINLEDRNLPLIAQRRLLKPRNDVAEIRIDKPSMNSSIAVRKSSKPCSAPTASGRCSGRSIHLAPHWCRR